MEREWRHKWKQWERNTSSEEEQWPERRPEEEHEQKGPTTEKEFGPSQKQVGKERPERRSTAAASSDEVARRPAFHPEHRPGQPDWDPFFQEGRGKKSREDRKQRRANNPDVQARKEQGLKEGFPEHPPQQQTVGSYKWRLMKEREKEMLEDERKIMLERKQLQEERAAFLAEREDFLEQREKREASIHRNVRLVSVRPERRPNPYKRERRTRRRRRREEASEEESEGERPERRPNSGESSKKDDEAQENEKEEEKEIKEEQQKQDQESSSGTEESLETPKCVPPVEKPEEKDEKMKNEKLENEPEAMQIDPKDF